MPRVALEFRALGEFVADVRCAMSEEDDEAEAILAFLPLAGGATYQCLAANVFATSHAVTPRDFSEGPVSTFGLFSLHRIVKAFSSTSTTSPIFTKSAWESVHLRSGHGNSCTMRMDNTPPFCSCRMASLKANKLANPNTELANIRRESPIVPSTEEDVHVYGYGQFQRMALLCSTSRSL
ncbi:hypothetical protein HPB47_017244 [Ixodes persulcatus]|uniref:Uncharacterized protein n=1 Tax=Ixodes persulcatus TaxID=34615 RepID=A0AC60QRA4_IXOPE|nr:hypothetical protein HPB47_017244 [Ixodes persulcatus]